MRLKFIALLFILVGLTISLPSWAAKPLAQLQKLADAGAQVSALVVDLDDAKVLAQLNAEQALIPASTSKLYAAAGALLSLGPNYRFKTELVTNGEIENGQLQGDLILIGAGDPTLDTTQLQQLINELKARGIHTINGNLAVNNHLFVTQRCQIKDRCKGQAAEAYSAPLSAAGSNFGTLEIRIYPAESAQQQPKVVLNPSHLQGYSIVNQLKSTTQNSNSYRVWRDANNRIYLTGHIATQGPRIDVYRAVDNADQLTLRVLQALLKDADIRLTGQGQISSALLASGQVLAHISSAPLINIIGPMLEYSNNYTADMLTLAAAKDIKRPSLTVAAKQLEQLAQTATALSQFARQSASSPKLTSGSGLSIDNQLAAQDLVALLEYMRGQQDIFPALYGALPVPKHAELATLKNGTAKWLNQVSAKTGTLSSPYSVHSIAGYLRLDNGHLGAFAILVNGTSSQPNVLRSQAIRAYTQDIEGILDSF